MNEVLLYFHQHNGIEVLAYIISILGVSVVAWGLYGAYTYHFCYIATLKHSLDLIERKVWKPYWKQKNRRVNLLLDLALLLSKRVLFMKAQPQTEWIHINRNKKYLVRLECCEGLLSLSCEIHNRVNGNWEYTNRLWSIGCRVKSSKILSKRRREKLKQKLRATIVHTYDSRRIA